MIFNALSIENRRNCSSFQELEQQILNPIHNQKNVVKANITQLNQDVETISQRLQSETSLRASLVTANKSVERKNKDIDKLLSIESMLIMQHVDLHHRITIAEAKKLCPNVSPQTIKNRIANLVSSELLEMHGKARGTWYSKP